VEAEREAWAVGALVQEDPARAAVELRLREARISLRENG